MPTVILDLPNELEQKLKHRATAQGLDVTRVALDILKKELYDSATVVNPNDLPYEVWREQFEAWIKNIPQVNAGFVDDSRESIYEGRGE